MRRVYSEASPSGQPGSRANGLDHASPQHHSPVRGNISVATAPEPARAPVGATCSVSPRGSRHTGRQDMKMPPLTGLCAWVAGTSYRDAAPLALRHSALRKGGFHGLRTPPPFRPAGRRTAQASGPCHPGPGSPPRQGRHPDLHDSLLNTSSAMSTLHPKPSRWRIGCFGSLVTLVGVFILTLVWSSSMGFWGISAIGCLIFGLPFLFVNVLGAIVVFLVTGWLIERRNLSTKTQRLLLLTPWILVTAFWLASARITATPRARFASIVTRPVPSSAQDIKAAGLNSFLARRWLLSFTIDPARVGDIVSRHSLTQTNYYDLQAMVDRDMFFKQILWAHNVGHGSNALFYSRFDTRKPGGGSGWTCFIVDTNSFHAWFMTGYQN